MKMNQLDAEVADAAREMNRTHKVWMDTTIFAPAAVQAQVRADKDAAASRYSRALSTRGQCGGRAYPTWSEANGGIAA